MKTCEVHTIVLGGECRECALERRIEVLENRLDAAETVNLALMHELEGVGEYA